MCIVFQFGHHAQYYYNRWRLKSEILEYKPGLENIGRNKFLHHASLSEDLFSMTELVEMQQNNGS